MYLYLLHLHGVLGDDIPWYLTSATLHSNVLSEGLGEGYQANHEDIDQEDVDTGLGLLEVDDFDAM